MKNRKSLKAIPIEQDTNEPIRKFDAMSRKQKYYFLFLLASVNFLFVASHKYGPPFYHIETIPFEKSSVVSSTRKFFLKIGDFNFLNDFITLDMILLKNYEKEEKNYVDVSIKVNSIKGRRSDILYYQNSKQYEFFFNTDSKVSNKIRLFSREIVDFVRLESDLVLKFHYDESIDEDMQYSGAFIFAYIDASHAIIEALLRLIFFIFSIVWLCYFYSIDFSKTSSPLQLKSIYFVLILTVFSSNPLFVLSYFTESHFLSFIDSIFSKALFFSVLAVSLIILDSTHVDQFKITKKWLFIESLPFAVTFSFFFVDEFYYHYSDNSNDSLVKLFNFFKFLGTSFCCMVVFVSSILLFKAKDYLEKGIVILMILITIMTSLFFEYVESIESLIPTNHAIQIYTFASVATYVFFLAFFYMPVDPMSASDDLNEYNNLTDDDSYDVADPM